MLMRDAVLPLSLSSLAARRFSFVRRGTEGLTESGAEVNGAGGDDVEIAKMQLKRQRPTHKTRPPQSCGCCVQPSAAVD